MVSRNTVVQEVITTAMHMLHDSYLYGSDLWPVNGFKAGSGIGSHLEDCIHVGANSVNNQSGRLYFNIFNTTEERITQQAFHIKQIFDFTLRDGIRFEDDLRGRLIEPLWFSFAKL